MFLLKILQFSQSEMKIQQNSLNIVQYRPLTIDYKGNTKIGEYPVGEMLFLL
jgi:hypothetical protein